MGLLLEASVGESIIQAIMNGLTTLATMVVNFFTSLFTGVIGIIYADGALTVVGWLILLGLAFGAFWFVFRWIRSLIKFR